MDVSQTQIILRLVLAVLLGGIIGLEREIKKREAGLQTYSLVTLGSCLFTIIGCQLCSIFGQNPSVTFDPLRIILAVATGIGFIAAGAIIYRQPHIEGLTTAAGLWMAAAIGIAVGLGLYFVAVFTTILVTLILLIVFGRLERRFFKKD